MLLYIHKTIDESDIQMKHSIYYYVYAIIINS